MDDDLALVYMWAFKKGEEKSKKRIEELEAALRNYVCDCMPGECPDGASKQCGHTARAALGEKK
jgi:hypothetical protein